MFVLTSGEVSDERPVIGPVLVRLTPRRSIEVGCARWSEAWPRRALPVVRTGTAVPRAEE